MGAGGWTSALVVDEWGWEWDDSSCFTVSKAMVVMDICDLGRSGARGGLLENNK